jgi:tRNA A-37 threonylcarbamoyl transferase component Bud32
LEQKTINRRYRIDRLIGEGGMAEVYLGHDLLLNRPVAVKMLRSQYARDPNFRARFEREAQAAASFTHPNIIDIYDVGEEGETPYIVMEYGAGDNLQQIIESEGPFEPDDVASLIEQVASALDYAHERGFVHRDIKPQNILVDEQGLAKVVDFGIAKSLADTDLTVAGTGLGTVHYVSPEQASGLMATPSSDIYSLAVIAYEMLAGQLPFDADTPVGIAMQHVNETPPNLSKLNPAVPRQVSDIIMRALAKDPTKRYPTAGAFASTLTNWRNAKTGGGQRQTSRAAAANRTTVALPQGAAPPAQQRRVADTWVGTPVAEGAGRRVAQQQASGCTSWIVGTLVLGAIAALLWFGFQLPDRLRGLSEADATATIEAESTATTEPTEPAIEPTQPPADPTQPEIVPNETQPPTEVSEEVNIEEMRLFGLPADQAQGLLEGEGLNVQREEQASTDVPEGSVIGTDPSDVASPGDTVRLFVSVGDKVQIPHEIQGAPLDEVISTLEGLGFEITDQIGVDRGRIESFGINLEEAGIVDQDVVGVQDNDDDPDNDPSFGAWMPPGTAITLVYYDESLNESE